MKRTLAAVILLCAVVVGTQRAAASTRACPDTNSPNTIELSGGTPQTARLGSAFAQPLQVTLANTNGCPLTTGVVGNSITFSAPSSGASGVFAASGSNAVTVGTDGQGGTSAQLSANGVAGYYTVVASSAFGSVAFSLNNSASGLAATVAAQSGAQSAQVGARYPQPLTAVVRDANGTPVAGAAVTFSLGTGATFDGGQGQATEQTDATGTATSPRFTAAAVPGAFTASASVQGVVDPALYSMNNLAAPPQRLTALMPVTQQAAVGGHFAKALEVRIRTATGAPVSGATVTFVLGGAQGAAGASFAGGAAQATATTGANGVAVSPHLIANTVAGSYTAAATTPGAASAASFALRNLAGKPVSLAVGAASTQTTAAGSRFPVRLAVKVVDTYGNAVKGASVVFSAPSRGAGGRFSHAGHTVHVRTDAQGVAVAPSFVANRTRGGYVVSASIAGHSVAFALVNR
jgi:hypothetical protein